MCLIFTAAEAHPQFKLIIAANRDEFYDRPSGAASFWPEAPQLLAGRDLRAGGTWLGITKTGRIAALTNYRDPDANKTAAPSRGHLVSDFLLSEMEPVRYLERISSDANRYNGFNLLVGQGPNLYCFSSRTGIIQTLEPGIHGLSNQLLDTPWPKVEKGKRALAAILAGADVHPDDLLRILDDRTPAPDGSLPDTGVGLEMERMLSPVFVSSPDYGTRSSTVILLDQTNRVLFAERSFHPELPAASIVTHSFMLQR
jgi:uncharacterized protein with NRDE domain